MYTTSSFDDSSWTAHQLPFGYDDDNPQIVALLKTHIKVLTTYHRFKFSITQDTMNTLTTLGGTVLHLACDDRCVAFINNNRVLNEIGANHDYVYWNSIVRVPVSALVVGENLLAVELANPSATSSDAFLDTMIIGDNVVTAVDGLYRYFDRIPTVIFLLLLLFIFSKYKLVFVPID